MLRQIAIIAGLFSAHAEVFPRSALKLGGACPLLRACGGISPQKD
ncbi:hypothetical protein HMPREF0293_0488 [Corynebacterium glucuronolyticum ATCC 51866]|uniref:Uncharacterized protein n=1 Tax=Corynebacterium glucuronolyticum ATCC 51866 TaxID=548478 RepID=A0ABP2DZI1_9CORY|nr:hypothetical protein HMPREF0293_0488 [Corynebacterium glucuronolyticum ATCC 51866]